MIGVVGAGPIGSYLAYLLAKSNFKVDVYEEHKEIGKPVQCTGILTHSISKLIKLDKKFILNKIKKYKIYSPSGKFIEFKLKKPDIIVDRTKFDQHLANMAKQKGANFYLNHKFMEYKHKIITLKDLQSQKFLNKRADILIGADGPLSSVSKLLNNEKKFVTGIQGRYELEKEKDTIEVWLGHGDFAWVVPESNKIARIGICFSENPDKVFKKFIEKRAKGAKFIEYQSGLIPVYDPGIRLQSNNIYILGDAASQVKPTTYGGIIQGLTAAKYLHQAIVKNEDYKLLLKDTVNKELDYSSKIRKILDKFSAEDYNKLIDCLSKEKAKKLLENFDRDHPSEFIFKLALAQPKLLRFTLKLL